MRQCRRTWHGIRGRKVNRFWLIHIALACNLSLYGQALKPETKLVVRKNSETSGPLFIKNGQDTNVIFPKVGENFIEEFEVLRNDKNIRHGSYVKYKEQFGGIKILESGSYLNGEKNGVWENFYDIISKNSLNSIKERGSYVNGLKNGVWTSYYLDTIPENTVHERFGSRWRTDSINVSVSQQAARLKTAGMYLNGKKVGEWTSFARDGEPIQIFNFSRQKLILDQSAADTSGYNLNRRALFVGGSTCLVEFLTLEAHLGLMLIGMTENKRDSTLVTISFTIDKAGNLTNPKIDASNATKEFDEEVIRVINHTEGNWIPAIEDSKAIDSIYRIEVYVATKTVSTTKYFRVTFKPILT